MLKVIIPLLLGFLVLAFAEESSCSADISVPYPEDDSPLPWSVEVAISHYCTWSPEAPHTTWYGISFDCFRPCCGNIRGNRPFDIKHALIVDGGMGSLSSPFEVGEGDTQCATATMDNAHMRLLGDLHIRGSELYNIFYSAQAGRLIVGQYRPTRFDPSYWTSIPSPYHKYITSLDLGKDTLASLRVAQFGDVNAGADGVSLGLNSGGDGRLFVSDFGSVAGGFMTYVGQEGNGAIEIEGDGFFQGENVSVGTFAGASGSIVVRQQPGYQVEYGAEFRADTLYLGGDENGPQSVGSSLDVYDSDPIEIDDYVYRATLANMEYTYLYPGNRISLHNGFLASDRELRIGSALGTTASSDATLEGTGTVCSSDIFVDVGGVLTSNSGDNSASLDLEVGDVYITDGRLEVTSGSLLNLDAERLFIGSFDGDKVETTGDVNVDNGTLNFSLMTEYWDEIPSSIRLCGDLNASELTSKLSITRGVGGKVNLGGGTPSTNLGTSSILEIHGAKNEFTSGRLELNGGMVDANFIRLYADNDDPDGVQAEIRGNGYLHGQVYCDGIIRTYYKAAEIAEHPELENRFVSNLSDRKSQLDIFGNLELKPNSSLQIQISEETKVSVGSNVEGQGSTPIFVLGNTEVGGELNLSVADGFNPGIGDVFSVLVSSSQIVNKFAKVTGTDLNDSSFLGIRYREVPTSIPSNSQYAVEAIVLEKPKRINGVHYVPNGNSNIALVTHGFQDNADGWVTDLGLHLQSISNSNGTNFEVLVMDWRDFNGVQGFVNRWPWRAARNSVDIGESIGHWLREIEVVDQLNKFHLLGHSAGSYLVDSLADFLAEGGVPNVHATFFDAFTPPTWPQQWPQLPSPDQLGNEDYFTEHFVDTGSDYTGWLWFTKTDLNQAFNFDVTPLPHPASQDGTGGHNWPHNFYIETRSNPTLGIGTGIYNTWEATMKGPALPSEFGTVALGKRIQIRPNQQYIICPEDQLVDQVDLSRENAVWTGDVIFDTELGWVSLSSYPERGTNSENASVTFNAELDDVAEYMTFRMRLDSTHAGLLSLYVDGIHVGEFDEQFFEASEDFIFADNIWLTNAIGPGPHTITIHLLTVGGVETSTTISDVEFGKYGDPSGPIQVKPDAFTISRGNYGAGDLTSLEDSDNADLSIRRSNTDVNSVTEFTVQGTSPTTSPTFFEITVEGSVFARTSVSQTIEVWNFSISEWEQLDVRTATRFTDSTTSVVANGDLSQFVDQSTLQVEARVRFESTSARQNFTSNTDAFSWSIRP